MDDIVKASGYSRPTIYREFSGKEEIVECVAVNASREITRAVQAAIASIDNSRERIATAILTSVMFQISNRRANEVLSGDYRVMLLRSASVGVVETVTERWTPILAAAIADGTLRDDLDPNETMSWLTDLQILLAARYLSHNETVDSIKREIECYILDGLCARP